MTTVEHLDVLIVGAGISGIGAAYYLQKLCPDKSFAILERRAQIGGTWDLFRYPGIRSDSDMSTFGYEFKPWTEPRIFSDGESIRRYVRETAAEFGIDKKIRFGIQIKRAVWSTPDARWTVHAVRESTGEAIAVTCNFLLSCTGYYNYDRGFTPAFLGRDAFRGEVIHPQFWPADHDHAGKRIVVIGSGATAVTLVPELAKTAASVTMLQRSPSYVVTLPSIDPLSPRLAKVLPENFVHRLARTRNIALQLAVYHLSRARPSMVRKFILGQAAKQLGPDVSIAHFTPSYAPWDERLCVVPDGDLFRTLRDGRATIVTDEVETFEADGLVLKSGARLPADIVVTATGLEVQMLGGMEIVVDGIRFDPGAAFSYRAAMFEGLPNLAMLFGYPNQSWTLKVDLVAKYVCRLLKHMDREGYASCTPRTAARMTEAPFVALRSGYIKRAAGLFPKVGTRAPWRLYNNYFLDAIALRRGKLDDDVVFARRRRDIAILVSDPPEHRAAAVTR